MKQNYNDNRLKLKSRGPVWKAKIAIETGLDGTKINTFEKDKKWKFKIILN